MRTSGPGPIIVGVEHSERSRDALALGRMLARAAGAELLPVTVHPLAGRSVMPPVSATSRVVEAPSVARGLTEVAESERALAVVVGPSHRGPFGRVVPGSVGDRLLETAPCPVGVAPSGYRSTAHPICRIGVGFAATPEA